MSKTIPEIRAEADEKIYKAIEALLLKSVEQQEIAKQLSVSASWLSRWMKKNAKRIEANQGINRWAYPVIYKARFGQL